MAWFFLLIAGLFEVVWASGLKQLGLRVTPWMLALTGIAMIASLWALHAAMVRLPLGIAYPMWTGIGSIGAVAVGWLIFGQALGPFGIAGLVCLLLGLALLGLDTL